MCVNLPFKDLNSSPYPPTPNKYLYSYTCGVTITHPYNNPFIPSRFVINFLRLGLLLLF